MSKTSVTISDQSKKKLADVAKATGLSQSQVLDGLLDQLRTVEIVFHWKKDQPEAVEETAKKQKK